MCGILGVVTPHSLAPTVPVDLLHHRGPNAKGTQAVQLPWGSARLGATRLSIVDQSDLQVPSRFEAAGVLITFNGEIYNWRELRAELTSVPYWETQCDTEVVAHAWRRWGAGMLSRLNGMFALALVDLWDGRVFLARDRAGEKPLVYTIRDGDFYFASEMKALPGPFVPVQERCPEFDVLEFDCLETTCFDGVRRLGPGQCLLLDSPESLCTPEPVTWWSFPSTIDEGMSWDTAVAETETLLSDAIRIRAHTEVPTTALVSGGLDSAIVQAVAKFPVVYCCTFPKEGFDTMPLARAAAQGADVVPVTFAADDVEVAFEKIAYHLDTPATWSALGHWFLAEAMKRDGIKVVLSGEGSDELFAGYTRYRALWWISQARQDPQLARYQPVLDLLTGGNSAQTVARLIDRSPGGRGFHHALGIVRRFSTTCDIVSNACRVEWHTTMQCLLRMADRMTAAHSIENRSPFLDYRLVELAARMPIQHKITPDWSKAVVREVALRLGVPRVIVDDQNKRGLVVPWNQWRQVGSSQPRGIWDRQDFASAMNAAWRRAFTSGNRAEAPVP